MKERPSTVIIGTVRHVIQPNTIEVRLSLGFGIHVDETIVIKDAPIVQKDKIDGATHCTVLAIGGKRAYFVVPYVEVQHGTSFMADMFLYNESAHMDKITITPKWCDFPLINVAKLLTFIKCEGWEPRKVMALLRGNR